MTSIKLNRAQKLSATARFPRTFADRLANIPKPLRDSLTAAQIAAIIDGPMHASYLAGQASAEADR